MLTDNKDRRLEATGLNFVIVASEYNREFVDGMVLAAQATLEQAGAGLVELIRVPGAFEIPVVVGNLVRRLTKRPHAVLCLGLILRGATTHADHIGASVTDCLAKAQLDFGVPVIHEVLVVATREQAVERCLDPKRNRGQEAAQTAIAMARLMHELGTSVA